MTYSVFPVIPNLFRNLKCNFEIPQYQLALSATFSPSLDGRGSGRVTVFFPSPPPDLPHQGGGTNSLNFLSPSATLYKVAAGFMPALGAPIKGAATWF